MIAPNLAFTLSVEDDTAQRLQARHRRQCVTAMISKYSCPQCSAPVGVRCKSPSGLRSSLHNLRVNVAKVDALRVGSRNAAGCPTGCGDQLTLVKNQICHVKTGLLACTPNP